MKYQELRLVADDGTKTQAWWIPAPPQQDNKIVLVFFHGNAGTIADRLDNTRRLHDLGCSVLMPEYRGYGDSEGSPSEGGLYADADAALAKAHELAPTHKLVLFGRSLGGAVATNLASRHNVDGLIVESSFTSLGEMAGRIGLPLATSIVAYRFNSFEKIGLVRAPVLIVHGDADEVIPFSMGQRLRDAVRSSVQFLAVPGGMHNDTWIRGGDVYWQTWRDFLLSVADGTLK